LEQNHQKLINHNKLLSFIEEQYQIQASLYPLAGEVDLNFKMVTEQGEAFVVKVYAPDRDLEFLNFQERLLTHLESKELNFDVPQVIKTHTGESTSNFIDENQQQRSVRILSWISGRLWNHVNPHTAALRYELGTLCGTLSTALLDFDHPFAHREFEWDIATGLWVKEYLELFDTAEQNLIQVFISQFEEVQTEYNQLHKSTVHNDANDFNILVSEDFFNPKLEGLIDFGDAIYTQTINDLAICCSYAIMGFEDPLEASLAIVEGYHKFFPLEEEALQYLYVCIAIRLLISVTKSRINKLEAADNPYLQISDKAAWELLKKWKHVDPEFAHYRFRGACGMTPHPQSDFFVNWTSNQNSSLGSLFPTINKERVVPLDLSISSQWLGQSSDFNNLDWFNYQLAELQKVQPNKIIAGGYLEARPLYTADTYDKTGNNGRESRCMHLGIDFWIPALTPVHAIYDAKVVVSVNDAGDKKYGGLVILSHQEGGFIFYTLYGHLSAASVKQLKIGAQLSQGDKIGEVGNPNENGNWSPHLHFQIMLSLLSYKNDFPGVAYFNEKHTWQSICPNPNLLFKLKELASSAEDNSKQLLKARKQNLGRGMSLQYEEPLYIVRGSGVNLIDNWGRKYLDTVNNVAHVGHEHPRVVKAGQKQMALLNTNSRYLHDNITALADKLKETLPPALNVFHFVNSGSEANELALRMVKTYTGSNEMLVSEVGYHGNTNGCVDISSYKFDGKGGVGAPDNVHVFPMPDSFRGKYRGMDTALKYAEEVELLINQLTAAQKKLGGFIIEPLLSCGGQIELPEGFLKKAYSLVRKAGGLCISDEVQTGCGRMGKTFWGFQLHHVIPDIITIGKPLGNGHPVAAVVCTEEVANKFANGMEFFNTFGGNPVSCAIAAEVLQVVEDECLQLNALEVGEYLKTELKKLSKSFPIMGSIRGQGLFLGIELVSAMKHPLEVQAKYLVNRMKYNGILMSTDGPDNNVIKIKPPLVFSKEDANFLIEVLTSVLGEDWMKIG
jgi:4-aminobutyrate aminotransferase-like enzyme/Ser/Thr protein kinase RdoA (MazF antagonist)